MKSRDAAAGRPSPGGGQSLPPGFFVASLASGPFLAAGLIGLFVPDLLPPLAHPPVAWALLAVGVAFEAAAVAMLLAHARRRDPSRHR
jgi:hypothetical protein